MVETYVIINFARDGRTVSGHVLSSLKLEDAYLDADFIQMMIMSKPGYGFDDVMIKLTQYNEAEPPAELLTGESEYRTGGLFGNSHVI